MAFFVSILTGIFVNLKWTTSTQWTQKWEIFIISFYVCFQAENLSYLPCRLNQFPFSFVLVANKSSSLLYQCAFRVWSNSNVCAELLNVHIYVCVTGLQFQSCTGNGLCRCRKPGASTARTKWEPDLDVFLRRVHIFFNERISCILLYVVRKDPGTAKNGTWL